MGLMDELKKLTHPYSDRDDDDYDDYDDEPLDDEPEQEQTLKAVVDAWGKENRMRCAVAFTAV